MTTPTPQAPSVQAELPPLPSLPALPEPRRFWPRVPADGHVYSMQQVDEIRQEAYEQGARAALSAQLSRLHSAPVSAWMRPSVYPECLPETTADPDIAQSWRPCGHVVTSLAAAPALVPLSTDRVAEIITSATKSRSDLVGIIRSVERAHGINDHAEDRDG